MPVLTHENEWLRYATTPFRVLLLHGTKTNHTDVVCSFVSRLACNKYHVGQSDQPPTPGATSCVHTPALGTR
jgi:hypothetical protein